MLAIAAGQFRGPNYRGLIKEDMDLRDRLPPALNPFGLTAKAPRKRPDAVMPRYSQSATAARRHPTWRAATSSPRSSRTACGDSAAGS